MNYVIPQHEVRLASLVPPYGGIERAPLRTFVESPSLRGSLVEINWNNVSTTIGACDNKKAGNAALNEHKITRVLKQS